MKLQKVDSLKNWYVITNDTGYSAKNVRDGKFDIAWDKTEVACWSEAKATELAAALNANGTTRRFKVDSAVNLYGWSYRFAGKEIQRSLTDLKWADKSFASFVKNVLQNNDCDIKVKL